MPAPYTGRSEVLRSLDTKDVEQAKRRGKVIGVEIDSCLEEARRRYRPAHASERLVWDDAITPEHAGHIAKQWLARFLAGDAEHRGGRLKMDFELEEERLTLQGQRDGIKQGLARGQVTDHHSHVMVCRGCGRPAGSSSGVR